MCFFSACCCSIAKPDRRCPHRTSHPLMWLFLFSPERMRIVTLLYAASCPAASAGLSMAYNTEWQRSVSTLI